MPEARVQLAWLIYCYDQGYKTPEDRESLTNWLGDDPESMSPNDKIDQKALLEMADEILSILKTEN